MHRLLILSIVNALYNYFCFFKPFVGHSATSDRNIGADVGWIDIKLGADIYGSSIKNKSYRH